VNVVSGSEEGVIRRNDMLPYRPFDDKVPDSFSGYCYCLVSLRDRQSTYIGQTMNLRKRLHRHNEGIGGVQTSDPALRPWALMAYVCGFECHRRELLDFEYAWKNERGYRRAHSPNDVASLAPVIVDRYRQQGRNHLKCVQTALIGN